MQNLKHAWIPLVLLIVATYICVQVAQGVIQPKSPSQETVKISSIGPYGSFDPVEAELTPQVLANRVFVGKIGKGAVIALAIGFIGLLALRGANIIPDQDPQEAN